MGTEAAPETLVQGQGTLVGVKDLDKSLTKGNGKGNGPRERLCHVWGGQLIMISVKWGISN
jgi:hypothetical protein